tara:strand:+ start:18911 stop:19255 length:345 start_codon:yes stop_codon:yes gene_type:complete
MKILFLCTANIQRSRTAEDHFRENYPEHSYKSAGLSEKYCKQHRTTVCTTELLDWADKVFAMETMHLQRIEDYAGKHYLDKVENLTIEDVYQYMQPDLVKTLDTHEKLQFLKPN